MTPALECRGLEVSYGGQPVLAGAELEVGEGEILALLGPSGMGKTTLLYAVAGFLELHAGEIKVDGASVAGPGIHRPPEQRAVGVVFQHYALWPHLDAVQTVAYPLLRRRLSAGEAERRARELLTLVGVGHLAERRPAELSGGEQQRVGLARALARDPRIYLFDEPTAHLDAPLRSALSELIAERRRATGAAAVHATHDASEALAVADRVALLRDGRISWVGPPRAAYEQPPDLWSAAMTGPATTLHAPLTRVRSGVWSLEIGGRSISFEAGAAAGAEGDAVVLVRPEWASLGGELSATVEAVWFRGAHTDYRLQTEAGSLVVREAGSPRLSAGELTPWTLRRGWIVGEAGPSQGSRAASQLL